MLKRVAPAPTTGKICRFCPIWKLYPITPVNHQVCMFGNIIRQT